MVPTEAGILAEELLSGRACAPPAPQRVTLLGMNSKQILNNQPNKAVNPFRNEINKQYVITITRTTAHYGLSAVFIWKNEERGKRVSFSNSLCPCPVPYRVPVCSVPTFSTSTSLSPRAQTLPDPHLLCPRLSPENWSKHHPVHSAAPNASFSGSTGKFYLQALPSSFGEPGTSP